MNFITRTDFFIMFIIFSLIFEGFNPDGSGFLLMFIGSLVIFEAALLEAIQEYDGDEPII